MVIHDAIYVEAPQEEEERARLLMKEHMEKAVELPVVPLEIDIELLSGYHHRTAGSWSKGTVIREVAE